MPATVLSELPAVAVAAAPPTDAYDSLPIIVEPEAEERGRLKRRRQSSVSPRRASSPSRGHARTSGSRYRQHHRKHHRASSPASSVSPPTMAQKKTRRRSDAEPDHTFRGRPRNRSGSRGRTRSPILEDSNEERPTRFRRRSQPPSRHKIDEEDEGVELRRQRSYHNFNKEDRRDSKGEVGESITGIGQPV
ncbi:hypothetical protein CC86DRAFT_51820 [Ophiobolus disseminans]|uniref:Uncharacterized protein n=1 Tax=Ophiobolus disseminans TaxID=1469910 RepID=A0A6A6ZV50_9PLEO|nr:hypothetical protein CC86DRAFT_51820 [Ophiobolus disseminans]